MGDDSHDSERDQIKDKANWLWWGMVGLWMLDVIFIIVLSCICKSIFVAIKMISNAGDFLEEVKHVLFVPLIYTVMFLVWCAIWVVCAACLYSNGTLKTINQLPFATIQWYAKEKILFGFFFVVFLWLVAFIVSQVYFVVSGLAVEWYFNRQSGEGRVSMKMTMGWGLFYHSGTVAFGSFVLMIVWIVRGIVHYVTEKVKKLNPGNCFVNAMVNCIRCCCLCFEKYIKFVNKHAYTECILRSTGFCYSAKEGFKVVMSNTVRFGFLSLMTEIISWVMPLGVTFITTTVMYYMYK